jgi:hypothetical protein
MFKLIKNYNLISQDVYDLRQNKLAFRIEALFFFLYILLFSSCLEFFVIFVIFCFSSDTCIFFNIGVPNR